MIPPSRPGVPRALLLLLAPVQRTRMMMRMSLLLPTLLLGCSLWAGGPVRWSFATATAADSTLQVLLTATCEEGWHIYALTLPRDDGPLPTVVRAPATDAYTPGPVAEPPAEEVDDPNFGMRVRYHSGTSTFILPIERSSPQAFEVHGEVEFMACNDRTCLPPEVVRFSLPVPASR